MGSEPIQVLLVEDDEAHVELILRAFELEAGRMRLTVARRLREARAHLADSVPDIAVIDSLLPDGRGRELLPADGQQLPYPIVMMTSHDDAAMKVEAMNAGALQYIVKTETTLFELPDIVADVLRNWETGGGKMSG